MSLNDTSMKKNIHSVMVAVVGKCFIYFNEKQEALYIIWRFLQGDFFSQRKQRCGPRPRLRACRTPAARRKDADCLWQFWWRESERQEKWLITVLMIRPFKWYSHDVEILTARPSRHISWPLCKNKQKHMVINSSKWH